MQIQEKWNWTVNKKTQQQSDYNVNVPVVNYTEETCNF